MNQELPDVQAAFRTGRGTRDQIHNIQCVIGKKQGNSRETSTSASLTTLKHLTVWITTNCGKFFKRQEYRPPYHLLRNLYAYQETTVRTEHVTTDRFRIRKGVCQVCILSPCLFNLYAENIMQNARLDEAQAGIKIARRNINNLRYMTSLVAQMVKHLPTMQETRV